MTSERLYRVGVMVATKFCPACKTDRPLSEFHKCANAPDGLQAECKPCRCERMRLWRLRRIEKNRAVKHEWYEANEAKVVEQVNKWREENPEKAKAIYHRRHGRKREKFVEDVDRDVIFERDGGMCGVCWELVDPENWDLDHVIPVSKDGEHSYENTMVTHPRCNRIKGARLDWWRIPVQAELI